MNFSQHEIDQLAQNIFNSSLPAAWLKREQRPDYHLDYYVETFEGGGPSGAIFTVQLKGQETPKIVNNVLKFSMKNKHLIYYYEKVKQPVFLFVADVTQKKCYYIFLQKYLHTAIKNRKWDKVKGLTINIPIVNDATDHEKLGQEVESAIKYMSDMWPSSIEAAYKQEAARIEALDKRFQLGVTIHPDSSKHYLLSPVPGSEIIINAAFNTSNSKLEELFGRGKTVVFGPGEVKFEGSALFEDMIQRLETGTASSIAIRTAHEYEGAISISLSKNSDNIYLLHGITGKISGGYKEIRFVGSLGKSPLLFDIEIPTPNSEKDETVCSFHFYFDVDIWAGVPVRILPHFDKLHEWANKLKIADQISFDLELNGNPIFSTPISLPQQLEAADNICSILDFIGQMRRISQKFSCNITMPKYTSLEQEDFKTLSLLFELIENNEIVNDFEGSKMSFKITNLTIAPAQIKDAVDSLKTISLEHTESNVCLFGQNIPGWAIQYELVGGKVKSVVQSQSKPDEAQIELVGGPMSKLRIWLCQLDNCSRNLSGHGSVEFK